VEARLDLGGVPVTLADTAGLRDSVDDIEAEGVLRARQRAADADVLLLVFAADQPPDAETLKLMRPGALVLVSKCDLLPVAGMMQGMPVSARTGAGLDALRRRLEAEAVAQAGNVSEARLTRPRHRAALQDAQGWLASLETAQLPELRAESLRAAVRALGRITGQVGVEAVLDAVFAQFCIGK
jgi:tRNA modification GTPase